MDEMKAGLPVNHVFPGSKAARAGVMPGDRVISVNGLPVGSVADYVEAMGSGSAREMGVIRNGSQYLKLDFPAECGPTPGSGAAEA